MTQTSKCLITVLCAAFVVFSASCNKLKSRDQMNQGVVAYKNNRYADAVRHFKAGRSTRPQQPERPAFLGYVLHDSMGSRCGLARQPEKL